MAEAELLPIAALMRLLGSVENALDGKPVATDHATEAVVLKAQALYSEVYHPVVLVSYTEEGEYTTATVLLEAQLEGVGTSRKKHKALSYALEDLAAKLRKSE